MIYESFLLYLAVVNIALFLLMGIDKQRAIHGQWRIAEKTLFTLALLGGAAGGILGMRTFRHKTRHASFKYGFPAILAVQLMLIGALFGVMW